MPNMYMAEKAKYMAAKACLHLVNPLFTQRKAFLTLPFSTQVWWIEQEAKLKHFFYQKNLFSSKFAPDFHPHREPDPSPDMLWGGDTFYVNLFFQMRFEIFRDFIFYVSSPDILRDERRRGRSHQRRFNHHQRHQQCTQHTQQVFLNFLKYICLISFSVFCTYLVYFVFGAQQVTTIDSCVDFERNFFSTFETFHKI